MKDETEKIAVLLIDESGKTSRVWGKMDGQGGVSHNDKTWIPNENDFIKWEEWDWKHFDTRYYKGIIAYSWNTQPVLTKPGKDNRNHTSDLNNYKKSRNMYYLALAAFRKSQQGNFLSGISWKIALVVLAGIVGIWYLIDPSAINHFLGMK